MNGERSPDTHPIGDLLVDPATGEVLNRPVEPGESAFEYLTRVHAQAQQVIKEQEAVCAAAKAALAKLLDEAGLRSIKTQHGTPTVQTRIDSRGRPERVHEVAQRYELSPRQVAAIWECASALNGKQIQALAECGAIPVEAAGDLLDVKTITFVVVR